MLDDPVAAVLHDNAAESRGIIEVCGHESQGVVSPAVAGDNVPERLSRDQGKVAVDDQDVGLRMGLKPGTGGQHRVACSALRPLPDELNPGSGHFRGDIFFLVADHDQELPGLQGLEAVGRQPDHGPAQYRVQDFGLGRFKPGSLAGGQDKGEKIAAHEAWVMALNRLSSRMGSNSSSFWARMP